MRNCCHVAAALAACIPLTHLPASSPGGPPPAARSNHENIILADEMGLGKTVQTIAFLAALHVDGMDRPHLVVVPLSTLRNWEREFATWAPHLNVVLLVGNQDARNTIIQHELYIPVRAPRRHGPSSAWPGIPKQTALTCPALRPSCLVAGSIHGA